MRYPANQLKFYKAQDDSLACIHLLSLQEKITYFKECFFFFFY